MVFCSVFCSFKRIIKVWGLGWNSVVKHMPKMCEAWVFNPWYYTHATCISIHTHTGIPPPHTHSEPASERVNSLVQRGSMSLWGQTVKAMLSKFPHSALLNTEK